MDVVLARQAIFDRQRKVYGYELLFRSQAANNTFDGTAADVATMQVLANTVMSIGMEELLGGKKAFVNFDQQLLSANMHLALPPESLVVELLETVDANAELIAMCESIKQQGYCLALDDFTGQPELEPLAAISNLIKVDMRFSSREQQAELIRTYKPRGVMMLAEKIETYDEFEWARNAGFDLFQGYFFARPVMLRGQHVAAIHTTCMQLLREMQKPHLDFKRLRELIRGDVSLSYRLLRFANSAMFARRDKIASITHALAFLGEDNIRCWLVLATLPALATDKPGELVKLSLLRAQFCERLAHLAQNRSSSDAFLLGVFSLLDALLDQPLDEVLRGIDLSDHISEALLGVGQDEDFLASLHRLIGVYERGNWEEVERLAQRWGIPLSCIGQAYVESSVWAEQIVRGAGI